MIENSYYKPIELHYDREAANYEQRLLTNKTLQTIRKDFRRVAENYMSGKDILDFGCGTGSDLCYFAERFPDKKFVGLDISQNMLDEAARAFKIKKLRNSNLVKGSIEKIQNKRFDFIYVFFGSLNTVADLNIIAEELFKIIPHGGKILITFVNRWYPMGILSFLKGRRFRTAFNRLRNKWGGYSEKQPIESSLYFPGEIKKAFSNFNLVYKQGYSIFYPAWYQDRITAKLGTFSDKLWKLDKILNKTFMWSWGEYILLVFEKK